MTTPQNCQSEMTDAEVIERHRWLLVERALHASHNNYPIEFASAMAELRGLNASTLHVEP